MLNRAIFRVQELVFCYMWSVLNHAHKKSIVLNSILPFVSDTLVYYNINDYLKMHIIDLMIHHYFPL